MLPNLKNAPLPSWLHQWLGVIVPLLQILLILVGAWLLQRLLARLLLRACEHYRLPQEVLAPVRAVVHWLIVSGAVLLVLERLGVSAAVLWTAFTGFATVGAVAFFAAWSVLSNLFCAFLIFTAGPVRVGDHVELMDAADKPMVLGRVIDIGVLYITLEDATAPGSSTLLQIPNTLIFQRVLRRWRAGVPLPEHKRQSAVGS